MAERKHLFRRLRDLPREVGERIGLLDHIPEGLPAGAPRPRHTFRWDLDKTYLRTEFATIRQLLRTAFERGAYMVDVPGVVELITVIR